LAASLFRYLVGTRTDVGQIYPVLHHEFISYGAQLRQDCDDLFRKPLNSSKDRSGCGLGKRGVWRLALKSVNEPVPFFLHVPDSGIKTDIQGKLLPHPIEETLDGLPIVRVQRCMHLGGRFAQFKLPSSREEQREVMLHDLCLKDHDADLPAQFVEMGWFLVHVIKPTVSGPESPVAKHGTLRSIHIPWRAGEELRLKSPLGAMPVHGSIRTRAPVI
jgi:hypothetical protein